MIKEKIIVALDVNSLKKAEELIKTLSNHVKIFKVGMELFYSCGPKIIDLIKKYDKEIFLDLKLHDIPNTVYSSSKAITKLGVYMFNVHSSGGRDMMKACVEASEEESEKLGMSRPIILGVTVLTSIDKAILEEIGINKSPEEQILSLARLVKDSGLDGVVASPKEASSIREKIGKDFLIVTPGVRPQGSEKGDQKRVSTPNDAIASGADYVVIGRPIIKAKEPIKVIEGIKI